MMFMLKVVASLFVFYCLFHILLVFAAMVVL